MKRRIKDVDTKIIHRLKKEKLPVESLVARGRFELPSAAADMKSFRVGS